MPINASIPMSYRPNVALQMRDPLADAERVQSLQARQSQLQDAAELRQFSKRLAAAGKSGDPLDLAKELIASGRPDMISKGVELQDKIRQMNLSREAYAALIGTAPTATPAAAPAARPAQVMMPGANGTTIGQVTPQSAVLGRPLGAPGATPPPINAMSAPAAAPVNAMMVQPGATNQTAEINRLMDVAMRFPGTEAGKAAMERAKMIQQMMPKPVTDTELVRNYNAAVAQGYKGSLIDFKMMAAPTESMRNFNFARQQGYTGTYNDWLLEQKRASAMQLNMPPEKYPPVAVVNPKTGQVEYVSRAEALATRAQPASEQTTLPAKEVRKREANWASDNSRMKAIEANAASDAADLRELANHPGLSGMTGIVAGRTPNIDADTRRAQALYNKIIAKGGFQMLADMREASKTGGALGNVSDREGLRLEQAFGALDQTQDTEDVRKTLLDLADRAEIAAARSREKFDETYSYRREKPAPAAAGAATQSAGGVTVTTPDGQVFTFPNEAAAAEFKEAAGL